MKPNRAQDTSRTGFTLLEILVVVGIIALLFGVLLPTLGRFWSGGKSTATHGLIEDLEMALHQYQSSAGNGSFPIRPGGDPDLFSGNPGYYLMNSAPEGSKSDGSEDNRALVKMLEEQGLFSPSRRLLRKGLLLDHFGHPLVVRFLLKPRNAADPDAGPLERVYIWSYGPDGVNEINATPSYTYQGPPNYDRAEARRIEQSRVKDAVTNW